MPWEVFPYAAPLVVASATSAALASYAWSHRRRVPGAPAFTLLIAAVAWWCLGNALQLVGNDLAAKILWSKLQYPGIMVIPLAWLAFALQYTGRGRWITRGPLAAASVLPLLTLLVVFTNEAHGLMWSRVVLDPRGAFAVMVTTRGPWFWVTTGYAYACLLVGTLVMFPRLMAASNLSRWQARWLLLGLLIPWATNAVFVFSPESLHQDPTPLALTVSGLAFGWGLFRHGLLDIIPIAREAVVDGMGDAMLVLDTAGRVVDLNGVAAGIVGVSEADAIGRPALEVLKAWPQLIDRFRDVVEGREEIAVGEGAGLRHFDLRLSALAGRDGRVTGRLIVWRDVTDRRRAEDALREQKQFSENLLAVARATTEQPTLEATLQNTLNVASSLTGAEAGSLVLLDEAGAFSYSLMAQGGLGLDHSPDTVEKGLAGWVMRNRQPALLPDVREDGRWLQLPGPSQQIRSALAVPIASGPILVGVLSLLHGSEGHFTPAHLDFIQAAANQMALAVRNAQIFDARSRMAERQTRLYEVLRAIGDTLDPDEVARLAVSAIAQRTGWPSVAIAVPDEGGLLWKIRAASVDMSRVGPLRLTQGVLGRTFASGRTQLVTNVGKDLDYVPGSSVVCSELAVPLKRAGEILGVLNLESDQPGAFGPEDVLLAESLADAVALALENARLYAALAVEHERLQVLERLRDDLTHTLVHDLRNPLTTVSGVLEALQVTAARSLPAAQLEMLEVARRGADRMAALIDAILDVSRLESGKLPLKRGPTLLAPLVEEMLRMQAPAARDKALRLESAVPPTLAPAFADPVLIGRVLQNLVGNAVKFTPAEGSVRIQAELEACDPPMLRIAVSDSGPGILPEVRDRLFQKFAAAGDGQGSGLGLAFCRLVVEAHGGRIWADAAVPRGATFTFTLPVAV